MVTVITETGARIELTTEQINDGVKAEAFVAEQRTKLGLPIKPPKAAASAQKVVGPLDED